MHRAELTSNAGLSAACIAQLPCAPSLCRSGVCSSSRAPRSRSYPQGTNTMTSGSAAASCSSDSTSTLPALSPVTHRPPAYGPPEIFRRRRETVRLSSACSTCSVQGRLKSALSRATHQPPAARTGPTSRAGGDKAAVEIRLTASCINSLRRPLLVSSNSCCHAVITLHV